VSCHYSHRIERKGEMDNSEAKRKDLIGGWRKLHNKNLYNR
jgi:hypothetical protein